MELTHEGSITGQINMRIVFVRRGTSDVQLVPKTSPDAKQFDFLVFSFFAVITLRKHGKNKIPYYLLTF
jgi:hypothetical protein